MSTGQWVSARCILSGQICDCGDLSWNSPTLCGRLKHRFFALNINIWLQTLYLAVHQHYPTLCFGNMWIFKMLSLCTWLLFQFILWTQPFPSLKAALGNMRNKWSKVKYLFSLLQTFNWRGYRYYEGNKHWQQPEYIPPPQPELMKEIQLGSWFYFWRGNATISFHACAGASFQPFTNRLLL
jgi:hypothetical protein